MTFNQALADEITGTPAEEWRLQLAAMPAPKLRALELELVSLIDDAAQSNSGVLVLWCNAGLARLDMIDAEWDRRLAEISSVYLLQ